MYPYSMVLINVIVLLKLAEDKMFLIFHDLEPLISEQVTFSLN